MTARPLIGTPIGTGGEQPPTIRITLPRRPRFVARADRGSVADARRAAGSRGPAGAAR